MCGSWRSSPRHEPEGLEDNEDQQRHDGRHQRVHAAATRQVVQAKLWPANLRLLDPVDEHPHHPRRCLERIAVPDEVPRRRAVGAGRRPLATAPRWRRGCSRRSPLCASPVRTSTCSTGAPMRSTGRKQRSAPTTRACWRRRSGPTSCSRATTRSSSASPPRRWPRPSRSPRTASAARNTTISARSNQLRLRCAGTASVMGAPKRAHRLPTERSDMKSHTPALPRAATHDKLIG